MEFFEGTVFYASAGALVVLVVVAAFVGMRSESFPGDGPLGGILMALAVALVVVTSIGAVAEARHEQETRRVEVAEIKAEEAKEMEEELEDVGAIAGDEGATKTGEFGAGENRFTTPAADIEGAQVFESQGCGSCHSLQEAGSTGQIGPSLDASLEGESAEFIRTAIIDPSAQIDPGYGNLMPDIYAETLTEVEVDALVEYLSRVTGADESASK